MTTHRIYVTVNGMGHETEVEPRLLLVHFLRDVLRLTGTHIGCDTTHCGACTVLLDGKPIKSCTMFAVQVHDCEHPDGRRPGAGWTVAPPAGRVLGGAWSPVRLLTPGML